MKDTTAIFNGASSATRRVIEHFIRRQAKDHPFAAERHALIASSITRLNCNCRNCRGARYTHLHSSLACALAKCFLYARCARLRGRKKEVGPSLKPRLIRERHMRAGGEAVCTHVKRIYAHSHARIVAAKKTLASDWSFAPPRAAHPLRRFAGAPMYTALSFSPSAPRTHVCVVHMCGGPRIHISLPPVGGARPGAGKGGKKRLLGSFFLPSASHPSLSLSF